MIMLGFTNVGERIQAVTLLGAVLLLCGALTVAQSGAGSNARLSGSDGNQSSQSSRVLQRAQSDWPAFLKVFRLALGNHNLTALYAMTSAQFKENCVLSNGRDIRKKFFSDKSGFDHYLEILTPGTRGNFTSEMGAVEYVKETGTAQVSAEMTCGWSLTFQYRMNVGWRLVYYGQPCEGC